MAPITHHEANLSGRTNPLLATMRQLSFRAVRGTSIVTPPGGVATRGAERESVENSDGEHHRSDSEGRSAADLTAAEARALSQIATETDSEKLLVQARNAAGKSSAVEQAALRRIAVVSAQHAPGTIEHACWEMVHAVEALRRLKGRKVWRMHRLRPKIEKDGEKVALEYCARNRTDGFDEVMAYGVPELTAEAIVLRFSAAFSADTLAAARARLEDAGLKVGADGQLS